jgi:hypothetical protein
LAVATPPVLNKNILNNRKDSSLLNGNKHLNGSRRANSSNSKSLIKTFTFDYVMDESTTQKEIFDHIGVKNLIDFALDGYSTTIFAYGQTGSGKTFTISGEGLLQISFVCTVVNFFS